MVDYTAIMPYIIAVATAIYVVVGYYFKGYKNGEKVEPIKILETIVLVVLMAVTGVLSGAVVTVDTITAMLGSIGSNPVLPTLILSAVIGIVDQFIKSGGKLVAGTTNVSGGAVAASVSTPVASPATAPAVVGNTVSVTGPFGGSKPTTLTGTRIIVSTATGTGGAFQVINDNIAKDFIVASAGAYALNSGTFTFSGNLSLITYGTLL